MPDAEVEVVAAVECPWWPGAVARASRNFDVVWIQHEFGIFGPRGDDAIEDLFSVVDKPIVTSLHTILRRPAPEQRAVLDLLLARSDAVVVMSNAARDILTEVHGADPGGVHVIPHGVSQHLAKGSPAGKQPSILTWGLLGPARESSGAFAQWPSSSICVLGPSTSWRELPTPRSCGRRDSPTVARWSG